MSQKASRDGAGRRKRTEKPQRVRQQVTQKQHKHTQRIRPTAHSKPGEAGPDERAIVRQLHTRQQQDRALAPHGQPAQATGLLGKADERTLSPSAVRPRRTSR